MACALYDPIILQQDEFFLSHFQQSKETPGRESLPWVISSYFTITQSLPLRPKTSGEYISSALAGGTMNVPGVVARAM